MTKSDRIDYKGNTFGILYDGLSFRDTNRGFIEILSPDGKHIGALFKNGGVPEGVTVDPVERELAFLEDFKKIHELIQGSCAGVSCDDCAFGPLDKSCGKYHIRQILKKYQGWEVIESE